MECLAVSTALWNVLLLVLNTAFCEDELWISVSVTGERTTC